MNGYHGKIEDLTIENENFRKVLYTTKHSQLVLMSLLPNEDIGEEIHDVDQFFRIEKGTGQVIIDDNKYAVEDGDAIIVPAGAKHNVINASSKEALKLYTVYSPPNHINGTIHITKAEAEAAEETDHFDGVTSQPL